MWKVNPGTKTTTQKANRYNSIITKIYKILLSEANTTYVYGLFLQYSNSKIVFLQIH